jgi:hypothetical protein
VILNDPYRWVTTRQWLAMLPSGGFRGNHAVVAIRGTPKEKLFPVIREWMAATNPASQWQEDFLSRLRIVPVLSPARKRVAAYMAVAVLGPEAKALIPELRQSLLSASSSNTFDAAFALLTIGPIGQATIAEVTLTNSEKAQFAKAATASMLLQPSVNVALLDWPGQTAEDINRLRCIFNLKCLAERFRAQAKLRRESLPPSTNAMPRSRRSRPIQPAL